MSLEDFDEIDQQVLSEAHSAATTIRGSIRRSRAPSEGKIANRQTSDPQCLQSNEIETLE